MASGDEFGGEAVVEHGGNHGVVGGAGGDVGEGLGVGDCFRVEVGFEGHFGGLVKLNCNLVGVVVGW